MTEVDEFLGSALPALREVETAFHNGDARPRFATWSHEDPVTLFGALLTKRGWDELEPAFEWLASRFSEGEPAAYDVIAAGASGDLGYIAAIEHTTASIGGAPAESFSLRVTLIFRREGGAWKVVHRHADPAPGSEAAPRQIRRLGEPDR